MDQKKRLLYSTLVLGGAVAVGTTTVTANADTVATTQAMENKQ
ncbi:hypothetical protein LPAF129_09190 [Ligilactobacillus pabuli]|uniref:Uncharacterized protein n=1 Tax=Ligilactobacillus pabuli TaxID=2886039 RepID=A0ABQ5JGN8_9LACO|nr:hypothetical protein [Ligilactobacillus pabuli]GKS81233.1 hypothetical protein LPAF129_09190 [Ligilactobacillus pabuli]